jgi:hypothetical protein
MCLYEKELREKIKNNDINWNDYKLYQKTLLENLKIKYIGLIFHNIKNYLKSLLESFKIK